MKPKISRQIRRDCLRHMKYTGIAYFFSQFFAIALPSVNALLIGNMADSLLALDTQAIARMLPGFSLAMILTVFLVPLFTMGEYAAMNKYGFAYDAYLISRFIRQPLKAIKKAEIGEVLERLEGDLGDFCWYVIYLYFIPILLSAYTGMMGYLLLRDGIPLLFLLCLVLLPALSVIKAQISGKEKAILARELSEYQEKRRTTEAAVIPSADFLKHYRLSDFLKNTFEKLYQAYRAHSGKKKIAFDSRHDALDFIIDQGVPLCIFALGGYYVYLRRLAIGILVGSPFLISAVQQFWTYGVKWIEAFRAAPQVAERIRIFYGAMETEEDKQQNFDPLQEIHGKWLTFSYKRELEPTVRNASFSIQHGQCLRIVGPNGCGKSTLASLISGLYPPDEGKLADEKGWPLHVNRLRRSVAFQEQNGAVFSGTLFENLFIQPSDTNKAISLMQEFGLEKSLDEWIEPEGANLSPGERKKGLLIRVLLKQAPFCVLDEPFNHLDEQGKQALIKHLKNSSQGLILISHQDFFPVSHILQLTNDQ